MSTIRIKRNASTTVPSGLTFGEPAFVDGLNSLYVAKNDGTSMRVGAEIDTTVTLGTSDNKIPTQKAVKTYIDNNIAGGSISSLNGLTGAVTIYGGSGISVAAAGGGITLTNTGVQSLNGATGAVTNVARINEGNTYSVQQVMNAGLTAGGTSTSLFSTSTTVKNSSALFTISPVTPVGGRSTLRLHGSDNVSTQYNNDIKPQTSQTGDLTHTLPSTTGTLLNTAVTSAIGGTGISVSSSTGAVTFTNTGVQSVVQGNQITVSGATGAVTIGVTANPSFTSITTTGNGTVGGDLTVTGNLTINGTSTTVNTDTMTIDDPMIILGLSGGLPLTVSDGGKWRGIAFSHYNGAGYTGFFGHDPSTGLVYYSNATIANDIVTSGTIGNAKFAQLYLETDLRLKGPVGYHVITSETTSNKSLTLPDWDGYFVVAEDTGTQNYILSGSGLTAQPVWIDPTIAGFTAYAATRLATARTFSLTGDVTATGITFDGTGNVTLSTTIAANSVVLGTGTTGAYVSSVLGSGIGITVMGTVGENATFTVTSGATSANSPSQIVARNSSGDFTAGTITAALTGNASTATSLLTTRAIGLTGDLSGTANFNGSADINISATIAPNSVELGTDTTGNYVATLTTSSTGLALTNSGTETAAMTVNFSTITTGLNMGTFTFATNEFINSSGTVSLGTIDGGTYV